MSPMDSLFELTTRVPMSFEAMIWFGCIWVMNWPCMAPPWLVVDWLMVAEPAAPLGCMADEPVVDEPEPEAVGRSVPPDGAAGEVCAKAGAAANAVTTRQAAICFFSIA